MSYDPHAMNAAWQRNRPAPAKALAHSGSIDVVRLSRLGILLGLVCFWGAVVIAVF